MIFSPKKIYFALVAAVLCWAGCAKEAVLDTSGTGGSLARFTLAGDYLYTVDHTTLRVYQTTNPGQPQLVREVEIGPGMETIFPYNGYLLLGSRDGMYIFRQENAGGAANAVSQVSVTSHFFSCDPVVAQNGYAYVTLRMEGPCGRFDSRLQVYALGDMTNPDLVYEETVQEPYGLGVDDSLLFVCNGPAGLTLYDIGNPALPREVRRLEGFFAYDVIPLDGHLLVVGPDDLYQFDYTDTSQISLVSTIPYGL
jgi:hypothetical protein